MSYTIVPVECEKGTSLNRPYYVTINGAILRSSIGRIVRYKDSMTAALGGAREVDRLKRFAATQASRMPESSDASPAPRKE